MPRGSRVSAFGLLVVLGLLGLAAPPPAQAATATVGTSTTNVATHQPFQRKAFYANGRYWVFYSDGTDIVYQTSTDGTAWAAKTTVRAGTAGPRFSVAFDGTNLHYAYTTEMSNTALFYRRGIPNADGTVTWAAAEQTAVAGGGPNVYYYLPAIAVDASGYPFIGYRRTFTTATDGKPVMTKASTNTGTWTTAAGFPFDFGKATSNYWAVTPVKLSAGRMLAVMAMDNGQVYSRLWTGSAWASERTGSASNLYAGGGFSVVGDGDNAHLAFQVAASGNAVYVPWTYSATDTTYNGAWGSEVIVQTALPSGSAPLLTRLATGGLYCFWGAWPTNNHIFYKARSAAGVWDATVTDWLNETTELLTNRWSMSAFLESPATGQLGLVYETKGASPYNIKLGSLNVTPVPKTVAGLRLWTEASTGLTMNGAGVATWADQSGTGNNLTQATTSRQPTVLANAINGRPALAMSAAAQQTMTVPTNFPAPYTVIYVAQMSGATRGRILSGLANNWLLGWWGAAEDKAYQDGWISAPSYGPAATTNPYIYSSVGTGALTTIFRNGVQLYSNASGLTGPNGLSLSGYQAVGEFSDALVAEVLVYSGALSATDRQTVEAYLSAKYGLRGCGNGIVEAGETCDLPTTWTASGAMSVGRSNHTATKLGNGKVLVAGGYPITAAADLYDPATGTFTAVPAMAAGRMLHTATLLPNGRVLVVGGSDGVSSLALAQLFDPRSNTWRTTGSLATARYGHTATLLANGKVLITGGAPGTATSELYDSATDTWSTGPSMGSARYFHTATLLPTGKVLVTGGTPNGTTVLATAEVYDAGTNTWAATGSMASTRQGHQAVLLANGMVLIAGGYAPYLATAEVYIPGSGTFAAQGAMAEARGFFSLVALPNGTALALGGYNGSNYTGTADLYDPATTKWTPVTSMTMPRYFPAAVALDNGKIFLAGGYNGSAYTNATELSSVIATSCCTAACQLLAAGTACRAAVGTCDVAETCNGTSAVCPTDAFRAAGTVCRASVGPCDPQETCNGTSGACPVDDWVAAGTVCRAAAGSCDVAESCTGTTGLCPADAKQPAGYECRASAGPCDVAETCNGTATTCPADALRPAAIMCRAAASICDAAEYCTGASAACPPDQVRPATEVCRVAAGACDLAEYCDGLSKSCPADRFLASTVVCRTAAGVCDQPEYCTGTGAACPADAVLPSTVVCRAAAGLCDVAEKCDGANKSCPADTFAPSGSTCRMAAGACDLTETCSGTSAACPVDTKLAAGTVCRAAASAQCDTAETCDGVTAACPADTGKAPDGASCTGGSCAGGKCWPQVENPSAHMAQHTCVILQDGTVKCWGVGSSGQLGEGNSLDRGAPVVVAGVTNARSLAVGGYHACAVLTDDTMKCWGSNTYGQLGD
ncbi:MAG TPA: kelch repeat-containing protein, partial [Polyangia bacterium]